MMRCARRCGTWPVSVSRRTTSQDRRLRPEDAAQPTSRGARSRRGRGQCDDLRLFVHRAKAGNITAIIFRLKTRAHWRERTAEGAIANPDGGSNSEVVLVLRDNNRDLA